MEMGRSPNIGHHNARKRPLRDDPGAVPGVTLKRARHRAVTCKTELAALRCCALEHHPADRLGKGGVVHPVHHHLSHGGLAAGGFAAGFIVNSLGEAIELAYALKGCDAMADRLTIIEP